MREDDKEGRGGHSTNGGASLVCESNVLACRRGKQAQQRVGVATPWSRGDDDPSGCSAPSPPRPPPFSDGDTESGEQPVSSSL
eukprot:361026-Chlamydomonas_euryale.AAC.10